MSDKTVLEQLRETERNNKKNLILDCLVHLVDSQKSFDNISMADVAATVGISTTTIYQYFPSRTELLFEAFIRELTAMEEVIAEELQKKNNPDIRDVGWGIIDYLLANESAHHMMSYFLIQGNMSADVLNRISSLPMTLFRVLENTCSELNIHGNRQLLSHVFISVLLGGLMAFKNYDTGCRKESIKAFVPDIVDFAHHALSRLPGDK